MPKPKNNLDEEAWKKINKEMDALDDAIQPEFTQRLRDDLFKIFQKKGRAEMLKSVDNVTESTKHDIEVWLRHGNIDEKTASGYKAAINEWQTNCKNIANEDLEEKPRWKAIHEFRQFSTSSKSSNAWQKIKNEMVALEEAIEKKGVFAIGNTKSLFNLYQASGRADLLKSIDEFAEYVKSDIKFSLENNKIDEKKASEFTTAINKWQESCKEIINRDLVEKPLGSHRAATTEDQNPSPSDSKNFPGR